MSGIVKGVKKTFKKIVKNPLTLIPVALAAGAMVYTAGAALGVSSMAGGWGGAMSSLASSAGLSGTLGSTITGALTQAGYGAAMGMATSALTGGDAVDGAVMGAAGGAVSGGIMGAAGMSYDPLKGIGEPDAAASAAAPQAPAAVRPPTTAADGQMGGSGSIMSPMPPATSAPAVTPAATAPGVFDKGGWLERNGTWAGPVLSGVGKAVAGSESAADAYARARTADRAAIAANYANPGRGLFAGGGGAPQPAQPYGPPPAERFDPATYGPGQWVWDRAAKRYVFVPANPQAPGIQPAALA